MTPDRITACMARYGITMPDDAPLFETAGEVVAWVGERS